MRRTDRQLLAHLDALRNRELTTCVDILLDLVKIEQRRLHVALGYSSLFAFATRHLRYSESAAGRRVQAARCVRDHPKVIALLRRGVVNLSTITLVSRVLTPSNRKTLLARIAGKSQREVEAIVAQLEPPRAVRDRIRPARVARDELGASGAGPAAAAKAPAPGVDSHGATVATAGAHSSGTAPVADAAVVDARGLGASSSDVETSFKIQFAAGSEFMRKFEEARALLSGRFPKGVSIESVFEFCMDAFLDRHSPVRRNERRKAREDKRTVRTKPAAPASAAEMATVRTDVKTLPLREQPAGRFVERRIEPSGESVERPGERRVGPVAERRVERAGSRSPSRRSIPARVRDAVFARDGGCCTFVGLDGVRCRSRHDVEIDHRRPVARGGANTLDNLRLLCAVHNRLEAQRAFGPAWMQQFARSPGKN